jgi:hypothetical protein
MTAMFSGVVGLPMYSLIMGMVDGLREMWRPEDDEDYDEDDEGNPLAYRNMDLWFREQFIPRYFGNGSSLAKALGLTEEQADTLARAVKMGPVSAYTDLNIGSSVSLDGLWFKDDTPPEDAKAAIADLAISAFGPLGSGLEQFFTGIQDINSGQWERGVEKLLPAFFRGAMKSYRLNVEGLKTPRGDEVKNSEYYTTGKLVAQSMGFEPTEVADIQKQTFKAKQLHNKIMKEREKVLNQLDVAVRRAEDRPSDDAEENIDEALEAVSKHNSKNGFGSYVIDADTIRRSLKGRAERRAVSLEGLSIPKGAVPVIAPLIDR